MWRRRASCRSGKTRSQACEPVRMPEKVPAEPLSAAFVDQPSAVASQAEQVKHGLFAGFGLRLRSVMGEDDIRYTAAIGIDHGEQRPRHFPKGRLALSAWFNKFRRRVDQIRSHRHERPIRLAFPDATRRTVIIDEQIHHPIFDIAILGCAGRCREQLLDPVAAERRWRRDAREPGFCKSDELCFRPAASHCFI
jgi:hypothetical protein